ncbi:nucleolin [Paragonimus heterotremus]|uniref:Nucleolin n=1 Tax=Paragonimus heterotremus TaxID=100268 RepID=A0A8J4T5B3_9TREM|nr:nucleolin [Paragonimus heterotremus]
MKIREPSHVKLSAVGGVLKKLNSRLVKKAVKSFNSGIEKEKNEGSIQVRSYPRRMVTVLGQSETNETSHLKTQTLECESRQTLTKMCSFSDTSAPSKPSKNPHPKPFSSRGEQCGSANTDMKVMDVEVGSHTQPILPSSSQPPSDRVVESSPHLTKMQRKRLKKKALKASKAAVKAKRLRKEEQEPPVSSSIVLPKRKGYVCTLDTNEKLLAAVQSRSTDMYSLVLKIQPIPNPCSPGLLKDLCPLAISVRLPSTSGARYAFLHFRNQCELEATQQMLSTKLLNGKRLKVQLASVTPKSSSDWHRPDERQFDEFDWTTLFVARLPRSTTRLDLGQIFRKASGIRMATYDDGSCKGTCFLTYRSLRDALQAFETRHGTFIHGFPIYVNFALKSKSKSNVHPLAEVRDSRICMDSTELADEIPKSVLPPKSDIQASQIEFSVDRTPMKINQTIPNDIVRKAQKQKLKVATNLRKHAPPKLLNKHQLKGISGTNKNSASTPLDLLLRPVASKPKRGKKTKKLTKRGKPAKHR